VVGHLRPDPDLELGDDREDDREDAVDQDGIESADAHDMKVERRRPPVISRSADPRPRKISRWADPKIDEPADDGRASAP
jgi:hypothetical protein